MRAIIGPHFAFGDGHRIGRDGLGRVLRSGILDVK